MERINATTGSYNFIDLFAGAGGLSEGFIQAGFSPVAHVEMNPYAAQTLETRTGYYYLKAQGKLDIYKDYISGKNHPRRISATYSRGAATIRIL